MAGTRKMGTGGQQELFEFVARAFGDHDMDRKKLPENVPWITKEGYFDPTKFPIDSVLKQAISDDDGEFRSGLRTLGLMNSQGRKEAGVFLLGLLVTCGDH
jgi:hypothetical protein